MLFSLVFLIGSAKLKKLLKIISYISKKEKFKKLFTLENTQ